MQRNKSFFSKVYEDVIYESSTFAKAYTSIVVLRKNWWNGYPKVSSVNRFIRKLWDINKKKEEGVSVSEVSGKKF
jgi:hypothetical protein